MAAILVSGDKTRGLNSGKSVMDGRRHHEKSCPLTIERSPFFLPSAASLDSIFFPTDSVLTFFNIFYSLARLSRVSSCWLAVVPAPAPPHCSSSPFPLPTTLVRSRGLRPNAVFYIFLALSSHSLTSSLGPDDPLIESTVHDFSALTIFLSHHTFFFFKFINFYIIDFFKNVSSTRCIFEIKIGEANSSADFQPCP